MQKKNAGNWGIPHVSPFWYKIAILKLAVYVGGGCILDDL